MPSFHLIQSRLLHGIPSLLSRLDHQRIALVMLAAWMGLAPSAIAQDRLFDVSGLAWISGDSFLVVHDAKHPEEADRPRAGIVDLPDTSSPVQYRPLAVAGADGRAVHDLESIARIPGTQCFLLAESGDDGSGHEHLYVAELREAELHIRHVADWPVAIENVEGMAVAALDETLVFIFAERAHGRTATEIQWAVFDLDPFIFGPFQSVTFEMDVPQEPNLRPVSSLEVDDSGRIFAASASDPDVDVGPFRSAIWEIGSIELDRDGSPVVSLLRPARRLATLDGLKVEAIAARPIRDSAVELFVGTDDEHYGAVVRRLPEAVEAHSILKKSSEK